MGSGGYHKSKAATNEGERCIYNCVCVYVYIDIRIYIYSQIYTYAHLFGPCLGGDVEFGRRHLEVGTV